MNYRFLLFFALLIGFSCCSSPQKLYEKGKYFKAFDGVLGDLQGDNKNRKNKQLLNDAFSKIIDIARANMNYLNDGYDVRDLQYNLEQYEEVDIRYVKGRSFLDNDNVTKYAGFEEEKLRVISDAYEEGKSLLAFFEVSGNKIDAQNAYYHFELVQRYGNGYTDINQWLNEAKIAATVIYLVDADLDSDFSYQWDVDRKFDNLEGEEGFVKIIYNDYDTKGDCNILLDFSRLDVDEKNSESVQNYTKEIIDGYKTEIDTSGKTIKTPIYKEVSGSVNIISITKTVSWRVDIEVERSSINCDLSEDRFSASVRDKVEMYEIRGDKRALPSEFLNNPNEEIEDTDDMVDELLDALYDKIRRYFY